MLTSYGIPNDGQMASKIIIKKKNIKKGNFVTDSENMTFSDFSNDLAIPIPRDEISAHIEFIKKIVPSAIAAGSYRRGNPTSSDMDVIVREPIEEVYSKLKAKGYIKGLFSKGTKKMMSVVKLDDFPYRQLDVIFTTPEMFPFALLYFTGSKMFNIRMRIKARKMGFKLNEYGLWKGDVSVRDDITTERDIFKTISMDYVPPEKRTGKST